MLFIHIITTPTVCATPTCIRHIAKLDIALTY
jgi:hypothetical protein